MEEKLNGVINIKKEQGYTSHDVVAIVRNSLKKFGKIKVGHTGTLDPNATGVLPICLGKATKLVDYIMDTQKTYVAEIIFGISTNTQDTTGEILKKSSISPTKKDFELVLKNFEGEISQIPPMFSALKFEGKKLYELARNGQEIERKPRKIFVSKINVIDFSNDKAVIEIVCSKGTYVRTICNDIGEMLGCFGAMGNLCRTKTGNFEIENSITLEQFKKNVEEDKINDIIISMGKLLTNFETLKVSNQALNYLINGNKISKNFLLNKKVDFSQNKLYNLIDENDKIYGLYKYQEGSFYPQIVLFN